MSNIFIVGYTGATGQELVRQLSQDSPFKSIVLIGRRQAELPVNNDGRFVQKIVDFEKLDEYEDAFRGCDIGFCCLGTTRAKSGVAGFIRVDRDYVVNCARVAQKAGCKHFQVLSSKGADRNSCILYNKTKGEVEELLKEMSYERLTIFRPGMLLDRGDARCGEYCAMCALCPCIFCCPRVVTVSVRYLATALIKNVATERIHNVELLDNGAIHALGNPKYMN